MDKYVKPSDKFRVVAFLQVMENYAWTEDGELLTGACAYWKAKGGEDWCVAELDLATVTRLGARGMQAMVEAARPVMEQNNDAMHTYLVDWELFAPGELTETERMYQDYEAPGVSYAGEPISLQWWKEVRLKQAA